MGPETPLFCVDMGSTRTRVWIEDGKRTWAREFGEFGARDVATGMSREWLSGQLSGLLDSATHQAKRNGLNRHPKMIAAAGMITSGHGLEEVDHVPAPATIESLACHIVRTQLPGRSEPVYLVPGVLTGSISESVQETLRADVMRGEETLCAGLLGAGVLQADSALLNLGSHWKWIRIDSGLRIAGSTSALTGELIHALYTRTLITSALPANPPDELDLEWVEKGFEEAGSGGLGRAMFAIRLLSLARGYVVNHGACFLYGAFIRDEIDHLPMRVGSDTKSVVVCGPPALSACWARYLDAVGMTCCVLSEDAREQGYLRGLRELLCLHLETRLPS